MIHRRLESLIHFVGKDQAKDADFVIDKIGQKEMNALLEKISNAKNNKKNYFVATSKPSKLNKKLNIIKAAGGMVINEHDEILLIYRNDLWDLPKGKKEKGERKKETALREVEEETGIMHLDIIQKLEATYHWYYRKEWILKESQWYLMHTHKQKTSPQYEEGIQKAVWVKRKNIKKYMKNMYPNIKKLISQFYLEN